MEDLGRFFRQLVTSLAASDPPRLHQPLRLADIRQRFLPYRAHRRTLNLESSEDYELTLIRLCAGEGGYARTEPDGAQAEFAAEAHGPNPDLEIVERREEATIILNPELVAQALSPVSDLAFAPPEQRYAPPPQQKIPPHSPRRPDSTAAETVAPVTAVCWSCSKRLPTGYRAKFCPHCGQSQTLSRCPECQAELEPGWRHCVNCGAEVPSS